MTFLLVITLGLLFVYALYFAAQTARIGSNPRDFLDGGMTLPGWSVMFILPAIGVAALGFERHLLLVSRYGLQASHVAVGLITVAADDIDWDDDVRIAIEERASKSPDALTGMEASLRFPGPETLQSKIFARLSAWQNWIFQRPNAVGPEGALTKYGKPDRPQFDWRRC